MKRAYFAGGCFWCIAPIFKIYGANNVICGYAGRKAAISLEPYKNFYPAEEYQQEYYLKNPEAFEKELVESGRKKSEQ